MIFSLELCERLFDTNEKEICMNDNVAIIMYNTVCLCAFVLLAVAFRHWWIVFFSVLFYRSIRDKGSEDDKKE